MLFDVDINVDIKRSDYKYFFIPSTYLLCARICVPINKCLNASNED